MAAAASPDAKTPARLALATAVLNVSTRVHVSDDAVAECAPRAVSVGAELLLSCPAEEDDARFRTLVALAQIAADGGAECKSLAKDLGLRDVAEAQVLRQRLALRAAVRGDLGERHERPKTSVFVLRRAR